MKKLKLLKTDEVGIRIEDSIGCDFCDDTDKKVVTSTYDGHIDESKNETQICFDCIKQLSKLL